MIVIAFMKVGSALGSAVCLCVAAVVEVSGSGDGGGVMEAAVVLGDFRAHPAGRVETAGGGVVGRGQEASLAHTAYARQLGGAGGGDSKRRCARQGTDKVQWEEGNETETWRHCSLRLDLCLGRGRDE